MKFVLLLAITCLLASCLKREEPLRWNTNNSVLLAYGELNLSNLIPDSLLSIHPDSSVSLVFNQEVYSLGLNDLLEYQDTALLDTFAIPYSVPVNFNAGQQFIASPEENSFTADGAQLTKIVVKSGIIEYTLQSTIEGDVIYTYQIPSAVDQNGNIFTADVFVPAAIGANQTVSGIFPLENYTIDLTGQNGNKTNTLLTNIICKVSSNYTAGVTVSQLDTLYTSNNLKDIVLKSAEGYFGQYDIDVNWEYEAFNFFNNITSGSFNFDSFSADLTIENGIGIDAILNLAGIKAKSDQGVVQLNHPFVMNAQHIINRASTSSGNITPYAISTHLNENNSNLLSVIEFLPDSIGFALNAKINPLGNISSYNDFIDADYPLRVILDAQIPLKSSLNDLQISDTIDLAIEDSSMINNAELYLYLNNGFPVSAKVSLGILDQNNNVITQILNDEIPAAMIGTDGKVMEGVQSSHVIKLSSKTIEWLTLHQKAVLTVTFNTPNNAKVNFYDHYKIDYVISTDANISLELE